SASASRTSCRRADYLADRVAYAERFGLTAEQHAALVALDHNAIVAMSPSWHHNYASLGWWGGPPAPAALHYPSIKPELVGLIEALHGLAHDADRDGHAPAPAVPRPHAGRPSRSKVDFLGTPALQ